jgi:2-C-methyl-D-erythritol 2,4-cyclodiphosphate synthase
MAGTGWSDEAAQLLAAARVAARAQDRTEARVRDLADALMAHGVELPPIPIAVLGQSATTVTTRAEQAAGTGDVAVQHVVAALASLRGSAASQPAAATPGDAQPAAAPRWPRTGIGYDSHRFAPGGPLVLGGLQLESDVHLAGHSDGDAICHAITDAVLGAANAGDIGALFPDTAAENAGRDSVDMLQRAVAVVASRGWMIGNVDVTVIAERPKIGPHRAAMRARLAAALGLGVDAIAIKGKTNETMGFVGRGEGLAVIAVALVVPTDH